MRGERGRFAVFCDNEGRGRPHEGRSSFMPGMPHAPDFVDNTHGDNSSKVRRPFWCCARGGENALSAAVVRAQDFLPKWGPPTS